MSGCALAWVEQPHTDPPYQRLGIAAAGLAALRTEHPEVFWHTLDGHLRESLSFWAAVRHTAPGGYEQRQLCVHVTAG